MFKAFQPETQMSSQRVPAPSRRADRAGAGYAGNKQCGQRCAHCDPRPTAPGIPGDGLRAVRIGGGTTTRIGRQRGDAEKSHQTHGAGTTCRPQTREGGPSMCGAPYAPSASSAAQGGRGTSREVQGRPRDRKGEAVSRCKTGRKKSSRGSEGVAPRERKGAMRPCPLSDNSGQSLILACRGLSANDP